MKKLFKIGILTVISMFSLAIGVSASETIEEAEINLIESTPNNIDVSTETPTVSILEESSLGEITPYSIEKPDKNNVVDLTKKQMNFSGSANRSVLYTNNHFKGKSKVSYSITNYKNEKLYVDLYKYNGWFAIETVTVGANSTSTGTFSGLNSSTLYFLAFHHPSDFDGYVK